MIIRPHRSDHSPLFLPPDHPVYPSLSLDIPSWVDVGARGSAPITKMEDSVYAPFEYGTLFILTIYTLSGQFKLSGQVVKANSYTISELPPVGQ